VIVDLLDAPAEELGGKGEGLARLVRLGLSVPPAVVVPVSDRGRLDDPDEVVRRLGEPLAVRSSGLGEDAGDRSAAGQFDTVLDVGLDGLCEAVAAVHRSGGSARGQAYAGGTVPMGVVIQRLVPATRAGVAFSVDPVTGERVTVVECIFGSGEPLVSGLVTPDRYRFRHGRIEARLAARTGSRRLLRTLRDDEVETVVDLVDIAERDRGQPVDVEFCFEGRRPWLLQCRPVTAR
jgi:phosphoenolpyruvate synthase/pyruvate phosphate dikinase